MLDPKLVPPCASQDIENDLANDQVAVYLYVGDQTDRGWKNATAAARSCPALQVYRVTDTSQIANWAGGQNPRGIVFGWTAQAFRLFTAAEAENPQLVFDTITEAMRK